jgi:hypothetical protein
VANLATCSSFQSFRVLNHPEKDHIMRIQKSFAAAVAATVAAVMFSAAIQPVEANIIVIDNFNQAQTASASGSGSSVSASDYLPGSFGGFVDREAAGNYGQLASRGFRTALASSGGGAGTLTLTNNGVGTGQTQVGFITNGAYAYFGYYSGFTSVDLTGQQYAGFWIETGATSSTKVAGIDAFKGYIQVSTSGGTEGVTYNLPSMWAPNTSTGILFSTLLAINPNLDFTDVDGVYVGISNTSALAGSTAYDASAEFKMIAVPEPSQISLLAGAAVTLGAWRRRRLRRDESANGEALAG